MKIVYDNDIECIMHTLLQPFQKEMSYKLSGNPVIGLKNDREYSVRSRAYDNGLKKTVY